MDVGSALARASRSRTSGTSARPAAVSCTLRRVRSNNRTSSAPQERQWPASAAAGHVQATRRQPKCSLVHQGFHKLPPHSRKSNGHRSYASISIALDKWIEPTIPTAHTRRLHPMHPPETPWTSNRHPDQPAARTSPRASSMYYAMGYQEGDFRKPHGRRGQRPQHHHAPATAACRSWPTRPWPASRQRAATPRSSARRPSATDGHGHRGHEVQPGQPRGDQPTASRPACRASGWTACWWSAAATRTCPAA